MLHQNFRSLERMYKNVIIYVDKWEQFLSGRYSLQQFGEIFFTMLLLLNMYWCMLLFL